jgi:hypothetical protein
MKEILKAKELCNKQLAEIEEQQSKGLISFSEFLNYQQDCYETLKNTLLDLVMALE